MNECLLGVIARSEAAGPVYGQPQACMNVQFLLEVTRNRTDWKPPTADMSLRAICSALVAGYR